MAAAGSQSINVLHVLRAPVGGLFRHVLDLAGGQAARGHRVGIIADATTGGAQAEAALAHLSPRLALGVTRVPMSRQIGVQDASAIAHVAQRVAGVAADVLHGHGAKGGAYARLASSPKAIRAYTPHGGSLHYGWGSPIGLLYLTLERVLIARTDLFLFESAYGREVFRAKLGDPGELARVVHNGVTSAEFEPVAIAPQATDLVFVGELRFLKGVDVLIQAIAALNRNGRSVSATIVGEGPDRAAFEALMRDQDLTGSVRAAERRNVRSLHAPINPVGARVLGDLEKRGEEIRVRRIHAGGNSRREIRERDQIGVACKGLLHGHEKLMAADVVQNLFVAAVLVKRPRQEEVEIVAVHAELRRVVRIEFSRFRKGFDDVRRLRG